MKCQNCGSEVLFGNSVCPVCGTIINSVSQQPSQQVVQQQEPVQQVVQSVQQPVQSQVVQPVQQVVQEPVETLEPVQNVQPQMVQQPVQNVQQPVMQSVAQETVAVAAPVVETLQQPVQNQVVQQSVQNVQQPIQQEVQMQQVAPVQPINNVQTSQSAPVKSSKPFGIKSLIVIIALIVGGVLLYGSLDGYRKSSLVNRVNNSYNKSYVYNYFKNVFFSYYDLILTPKGDEENLDDDKIHLITLGGEKYYYKCSTSEDFVGDGYEPVGDIVGYGQIFQKLEDGTIYTALNIKIKNEYYQGVIEGTDMNIKPTTKPSSKYEVPNTSKCPTKVTSFPSK